MTSPSKPTHIAIAFALVFSTAACQPDVLARAELGGSSLELVDARGSITQDSTALEVRITGWDDPSCRVADDEVSVAVTLRIPDVAAVVLDSPIDVSSASAPLSAVLSMGSMGGGCVDCGAPDYVLTGTVTFTALSATAARGSVDLHLSGDVPFTDQEDRIYTEDTTLTLRWSDFRAPMEIDHCD